MKILEHALNETISIYKVPLVFPILSVLQGTCQ